MEKIINSWNEISIQKGDNLLSNLKKIGDRWTKIMPKVMYSARIMLPKLLQRKGSILGVWRLSSKIIEIVGFYCCFNLFINRLQLYLSADIVRFVYI